jgi:acyl-CoA synthetase (NDP forming)/GNAT superfamily N-acetyltransferase
MSTPTSSDNVPVSGSSPSTGENPLPLAYPSRWDADVVLSDGSTVNVRPIRPSDGRRILEVHGRQSPESIYLRYFSPHPELSESEVENLTNVDYVDRMAFVALRGDTLVGTARYDRWPTRSEAEVAFFVDDAHRGRGLATLLLEYLAAAARDAGISAFTATVLPTNRRMVSVFSHAGFTASSSFEEGVIEVSLDLQPTPEAEAAIEARASSAEAEAVRLLLAPRSVAVIGASRKRGSVGHEVFRNLLRHEFAGPVYPVNRLVDHVAGVRAVASVEDIDGPVDLAVVAVPAEEVAGVIEQCGWRGARAVIVLSAGFAESGPEGAALSAQALRAARRFGMRLLGPNCLGVISTDPEVRLHATFATPQPGPGTVALLSESGTIGGVILDHMGQVRLGLSSFAAIGNRADVSANDLLQFWEEDPRTEMVLLYLESFGNPRKFGRLARRLARSKPVVAVKGGRAARAYPGEDVALSPDTVDALLRQTGVIRVDTLAQSLDVARVLAASPDLPRGPRVAVVGNAGGTLVAAADACIDAGLELAPVSGEAATGHSSWPTKLRDNPLDLGFEADPSDLEWVLRHLLEDDQVDSALVMCAPSAFDQADQVEQFGRAIDRARSAAPDKPVVACIFGPHPPTIRSAMDDGGQGAGGDIPVFDFPDAAAYALGQVTRYAAWRSEPEGRFVEPDGVDPGVVRTAVGDALAVDGEGWLGSESTAAVLRTVGLEPVASRTAASIEEATVVADELGYPVAVKAAGRDRHAKSEASGLALDVQGVDDLQATCGRIAARLGDGTYPFLIQTMAAPGVDVSVSVVLNPLVGPVLAVGAGGVATPLAVPRMQVLPLTDRDARRCVASSGLAAVLDDVGRSALEDLLHRVGALVEAAPELSELDLNPVIVRGDGAVITEARVRVAAVERDPLPPVRRV